MVLSLLPILLSFECYIRMCENGSMVGLNWDSVQGLFVRHDLSSFPWDVQLVCVCWSHMLFLLSVHVFGG